MIGKINSSPSFGTGYILRSKEAPEVVEKTIVNFAKENNFSINPKAIIKTNYTSGDFSHYLVDVKNNANAFWNKFKAQFGDNAFKC